MYTTSSVYLRQVPDIVVPSPIEYTAAIQIIDHLKKAGLRLLETNFIIVLRIQELLRSLYSMLTHYRYGNLQGSLHALIPYPGLILFFILYNRKKDLFVQNLNNHKLYKYLSFLLVNGQQIIKSFLNHQLLEMLQQLLLLKNLKKMKKQLKRFILILLKILKRITQIRQFYLP